MKNRSGLPEKLEHLLKIGLVDRSRLTQYMIAFQHPEKNVMFQNYREKILEVFYKIFDIVADNSPIYEKVRQQVLLKYRKKRVKRLSEAVMRKYITELGPAGGMHHSSVAASARAKDPSQKQGNENKKTANRLAAKEKASTAPLKRAIMDKHKNTVRTGDGT